MPDLDAYRADAERFVAELGLRVLPPLRGPGRRLTVEAVYERHAALFDRDASRCCASGASPRRRPGTRRGGCGCLLDFAVEGRAGPSHGGARRRAGASGRPSSSSQVDGERRSASASPRSSRPTSPTASGGPRSRTRGWRRRRRELNPLHREMLERTGATARELGWPSYREMCERAEGRSTSTRSSGRPRRSWTPPTPRYREMVEPELRETLGVGARRRPAQSDLPRFFRRRGRRALPRRARCCRRSSATMAGSGIDVARAGGTCSSTSSRARASRRARSARPCACRTRSTS